MQLGLDWYKTLADGDLHWKVVDVVDLLFMLVLRKVLVIIVSWQLDNSLATAFSQVHYTLGNILGLFWPPEKTSL